MLKSQVQRLIYLTADESHPQRFRSINHSLIPPPILSLCLSGTVFQDLRRSPPGEMRTAQSFDTFAIRPPDDIPKKQSDNVGFTNANIHEGISGVHD